MPQTERAEILKKMLRWIALQENGATTQALLSYTKWEICEGGAIDSTIKKYIDDLLKANWTEYEHPYWKITNAGKKWLEMHII